MNRTVARFLLLSLIVCSFAVASFGQIAVGVSVRIGPPALPVYAQPICPGPGYIWTPGYWGWNDDDGYYWVPGTWVVAPVGLLWTPGYWGWAGGLYVWHGGYWGPHVGFYGGINYGFGYGGVGFVGGEWRGGAFFYNRSVTNVSVTNVTNVYNRTVVVNENHVAFNGGAGGVQARATAREEEYAREPHRAALASQVEHEHMASRNRENFASANHGRPAVAATAKPGDFSRHSAVAARSAGGEYHAPAMSPREAHVSSGGGGNRGGSNEGFRPFTSPSKGGGSSASENRGNAGNRGGSSGGFRPFTPPSHSGNAPSNDRNANANRGTENRGTENRGTENRGTENRGTENRGTENRGTENRGTEMRSTQSRPNQSRPQNESRGASKPESAPRQSHPAPEPKHQSAPPPKEGHQHGR
jgi:hypothetical protein